MIGLKAEPSFGAGSAEHARVAARVPHPQRHRLFGDGRAAIGAVVALRRVGGETTFRHNISRYQIEGAPRELLIGAERAGGGVWRLIARWADEEPGR